jgi:hypothetical protein
MPQSSQAIYAFVDETGQDTKGEIFIVSVVVTDEEHDRINEALTDIEQRSNKRLDKWRKARFENPSRLFAIRHSQSFIHQRNLLFALHGEPGLL